MSQKLYRDLTRWYHLLDNVEDHADEARSYLEAFERHVLPSDRSLLELGSGAGNNAFYLKKRFECTLTDLSEDMLTLSRAQNPECAHLEGDMRSLRLNRTFDAVFVHDAICYMTSEADLRAALETAFVHTRPGGTAVFATDFIGETFAEISQLHEGNDDHLHLKCMEWTWDPDPSDSHYTVEYVFLLREGSGPDAEVRCVHDRHVEGLFSEATWLRLLTDVGYEVFRAPRALDDGNFDEIFVCRRPA